MLHTLVACAYIVPLALVVKIPWLAHLIFCLIYWAEVENLTWWETQFVRFKNSNAYLKYS